MRLFYAFYLLLAVACLSCRTSAVVPSSEIDTFEVAASKLNSIDVGAGICVEYTRSDAVSVSVSCPDNLSDLLDVKVVNGRLEAGFRSGIVIDGDCGVVINVSSPTLNQIEASSAARVNVASGLRQTGPIDLDVSSSAVVTIAGLDAGDVRAEASSSATIELVGVRTSELELDCSSSARINAGGVECESVDADASSASTIVLSGSAVSATYEASSAASIDAVGLMAGNLKNAKASSAAGIKCSARTKGRISEESSGSVSVR
jgi:hypothetical protein